MIEVSGNWVEYAMVVVTFLLGVLFTSGRPTPTLIRVIQAVKGWLGKLFPQIEWGAPVKWAVALLVTLAFGWVNKDFNFGEITPLVVLGLFGYFQENLHKWYEKLNEEGFFR